MSADFCVLLGHWGRRPALRAPGGLTVASLGAGSSRASTLGSWAASSQASNAINCPPNPRVRLVAGTLQHQLRSLLFT